MKKLGFMSFRSTMKEAFTGDDKDGKAAEATPANAINVINTVKKTFPGALSSSELALRVKSVLAGKGFEKEKSLLAVSLCCDEVNRDLEDDLRKNYGSNFSMGGLAGFPFGGVTSFGAMAHHIPEDGSCVVVYGPHVGVDYDGTIGKVNRRGRGGSGACCGSAAAAAAFVTMVRAGEREAPDASIPDDIIDAQQAYVGTALLPHGERLEKAFQPEVELPKALFDCQDGLMIKIVEKGAKEVAGEGLIALVGGIQINTPEKVSEYFLVKRFELRNNKGEVVEDLLDKL